MTTIPKLELPPAPPPPPPMEDIPDAPKPTIIATPAQTEGGGGRASLMEAIRNAGGSSKAGLKSVKEQKMEEKKAKQEELENPGAGQSVSASGGGDLMSDLANKLAMRRKGISGKPESTMDKMSMMIPTLPDDPEDNQDDDDDWD